MTYNFDEQISRLDTDAFKYHNLQDLCGRTDVTPMWVADMDFATPSFVIRALEKRVHQGVLGYTCTSDAYRRGITTWCHDHYGWDITQDMLNYIPGVVSGIYLAIHTFTSKGDKILIQDPVYHPFRIVPEGSDRQVVWNHLVRDEEHNTFHMDLDALRRDIKGCRMMILCNPHNPAGIVWGVDTLRQVASICAEEGVIVVSDEIHCDMLLHGRQHTPFASVSPEAERITITLQSPSKAFNMPGVVCAHAIVPNKELREPYFNYIWNSDMDLGNVFCYDAAAACYTPEGHEWLQQMLRYVEGNISLLRDTLAPYADQIRLVEPQASFLVFLDCRGMNLDPDAIIRFFADECHLALNPGTMFGPCGAGYMRINLGCTRQTAADAAGRIAAALAARRS